MIENEKITMNLQIHLEERILLIDKLWQMITYSLVCMYWVRENIHNIWGFQGINKIFNWRQYDWNILDILDLFHVGK